MKGAHFGKFRRVELRDIADARPFVRMSGERFPVDIEIKFSIRVRENSLPVFLLHHVPLRGEILVIQSEGRHPFRLRPQDRLEIIRRHDFVINRDVVRGESVVFAADVFGQVVKHFRGQTFVALEHHVLETDGRNRSDHSDRPSSRRDTKPGRRRSGSYDLRPCRPEAHSAASCV